MNSSSSNIDNLFTLVNSLTLRINELEKKINILQSNSINNTSMSNEKYLNDTIFDESIFRNMELLAPPVTRQKAFSITDLL